MKSLFRWTISKKVGAIVFVMLAFILALLVHSVAALGEIGIELKEIAVVDVPLTEHANAIEIAQLEQRILMDEFIRKQLVENTDTTSEQENIVRWNNNIQQEFTQALNVAEIGLKSNTSDKFKQIHSQLLLLQSSHSDIEAMLKTLMEQGYSKQVLADILKFDEAFDRNAISLIHSIESITQRKALLALKHEQQFEIVNYSLSVIALFIGIVMATIIVLSIKANIRLMSRNIERVKTALKSNEHIPVSEVEQVRSNDELSDLSVDLQDMIEHVSTNIEKREKDSQRLSERVIRDHLTGCFNRYKWDQDRASAIRHSLAENQPLATIFFDIDHFKKINDTYGHDVGDITLKDVVKVCFERLRKHDSLYRTGGEEFAILLPDTDLADAEQLAERLRVAIEDQPFCQVKTVTISAGVTHFLRGQDNGESFIKRADLALYQSKQAGRNCITIMQE
ncbi:GGDEF domain-containing protein [Thalassotalea euphylliae]|uniref:GGDEF domain-containing protein n=1 Tax=Thalassotalea euphylliae TaxID=1655234 RepID=UPI00363C4DBB